MDLAVAEAWVTETAFLTALARRLRCRSTTRPPPPDLLTEPGTAFLRRGYRHTAPEGPLQVIAPNAAVSDLLLTWQAQDRLPAILLTTEQVLLDALVQTHAAPVAKMAVATLPSCFSAQKLDPTPLLAFVGLILFCSLAVLGPTTHPLSQVAIVILISFTPIFTLAALSVLTAALLSMSPEEATPRLPEAALPDYTLLVPLYREDRVLPHLIKRLDSLAYPAPRKQVLFLVEADDWETRANLAMLNLPPGFLIFTVPEGAPRTKPRALNAALPFARGALITVYDAEDAPEEGQLRLAAETFASARPTIGCLQARLAIANQADSWVTRRFAQDYLALFDCIKRGFALAGWPVALGGSSNHFRTETLRAVGGWDAANVTEDADLGYRLALLGLSVEDLPSTTWEEAPIHFKIWRNQRIRWIKGWYQTMLVHGRHGKLYWARLDRLAFIVGLSVPVALMTAALFMPLFGFLAGFRLLSPLPFGGNSPWQVALDTNLIFLFVLGAIAELVPMVIAHHRRGWLKRLPWLLLLPITYLKISLAAWAALIELWARPHYWRKTPHGLSMAANAWIAPFQKQSATKAVMTSPNTATPLRDQRTTPTKTSKATTSP